MFAKAFQKPNVLWCKYGICTKIQRMNRVCLLKFAVCVNQKNYHLQIQQKKPNHSEKMINGKNFLRLI